jgi:predicted kinase
VILIGLPAAGKTTFYREKFHATHDHVSKDLLRNNPRPEPRRGGGRL